MDLSQDFQDLLTAFAKHQVKYLLIGGYAVAYHGRPRFTKDIDIWLADQPDNIHRTNLALVSFGAPPESASHLLSAKDDEIVWFGAPPARVDLLKQIPGVVFAEAFENRVTTVWNGIPVEIISAQDLIKAKDAAGRRQDLEDAAILRRVLANHPPK